MFRVLFLALCNDGPSVTFLIAVFLARCKDTTNVSFLIVVSYGMFADGVFFLQIAVV